MWEDRHRHCRWLNGVAPRGRALQLGRLLAAGHAYIWYCKAENLLYTVYCAGTVSRYCVSGKTGQGKSHLRLPT